MGRTSYKKGKTTFINNLRRDGIKGDVKMTIINRPGNNKTEPYSELRLYNEDLYLLAANHPDYVKNMLTQAGLPVYGVTARALPEKTDGDNAITMPGVLARFK